MSFTQAWLVSETTSLPPQSILVGAVCLKAQRTFLQETVVTPLSEKTAQICWQYPNDFPRMLKEARINSFDTHPSSFYKWYTEKSYLVGNTMLMVVDGYAQGSRNCKCFNRIMGTRPKENESYFNSLHLSGTGD